MRHLLWVALAIVPLGLTALAVSGATQDKPPDASTPVAAYYCPVHPEVRATWACMCPRCGKALAAFGARVPSAAACGCPWCPTAASARSGAARGAASPADCPVALLALKGPLGLTDKQAEALEAIAGKMAEEARGILSADQREKLKALSAVPAPAPIETAPRPAVGRRAGCGCCW